jgi:hypothetical protein
MNNPLFHDPNAVLAADLARQAEGRLLAVYASVRSTTRVADSLVGFGLPVFAYLLGSMHESPVRVAAVRGRHTAQSALLGLGTDVEIWTVLVRCASELTMTVDVAAGPWTTAAGPIELRVEWMRSDRVTTFHPRGGTVVAGDGGASVGLTGLEERLLDHAIDLCDIVGDGHVPEDFVEAMQIVEAAKEAASAEMAIEIGRGGER